MTGVRLSAAAAMTCRPTRPDPVKISASKGSRLIRSATSGPPVTAARTSGAKESASVSASKAEVAGVSSDGLTSARQPAASAATTGMRASCTG